METKERPFINILFFLLTLLTTLVAGSLQQGINPLETPWLLWQGIPFSFTLMIILAAHELGHYLMAKRHGIKVTLPYFIPAPSIIGTFGAFIRMKSPLLDRRMLLDVGAAGPLTGIIVAVPVLFIGLWLSEFVPGATPPAGGIILGKSLLFSIISWIVHGYVPDELNLILHPIAFSGWIGLLVTCLNLLPVGQLDGGHVAYAIFGSGQRTVAVIVFAVLLMLGLTGWSGWLVWAVILLVMGLNHPRVAYEWIPLDHGRKVIGWVTLAIFVLTFTPMPFEFSP
jgi:membrane-associated protease RseP (regulator of RpoE activity)